MRGLVGGDGLSGHLATAATAQSEPGNYTITQGTLDASPNYVLAAEAFLDVLARPRPAGFVAPDATGLASTVERAAHQNRPMILSAPRHGPDASAAGPLRDLRFDASRLCAWQKGRCRPIPPQANLRPSPR